MATSNQGASMTVHLPEAEPLTAQALAGLGVNRAKPVCRHVWRQGALTTPSAGQSASRIRR